MLQELAKAEKLEQQSRARQRRKEMLHRKEVERLWNLKKQKILQEREREVREKQRITQEHLEEEKLIEEQKRLLVEQHMPFIEDFCSRELKAIRESREPVKVLSSKYQSSNIFGLPEARIKEFEKENRQFNS